MSLIFSAKSAALPQRKQGEVKDIILIKESIHKKNTCTMTNSLTQVASNHNVTLQ
jgi:hypothetical protein